ncbi:MAG: beta-N-acetylhexosaminidase [Rhodospirillaceae bacterium]|nr:MAG: beta-N-acetylhexosaminidase [Rhodospirillaceae bacterium]
MSNPNAVIFGCSGLHLTAAERDFFGGSDPLGFILFQRNCDTPDQVRKLVDDLRASVGRTDAPVLIDQEGGRVARLKPPHWPSFPPAMDFATVYAKDQDRGYEAAILGGQLIAHELFELGITVDCAPVLDVPQSDADPIIGDRAFGKDIRTIQILAGAFMNGLAKGGVDPVIKHIPGHGRALVDSHLELPVVDAALTDLENVDFPPFKALNTAPWAMTAHVIYKVLDNTAPATTSAYVIENIIRQQIGFKGLLLSDDLSMKALSGQLEDRANDCLKAGCDVALHCNGDLSEMVQVAQGAKVMTADAYSRYKLGEDRRLGTKQDFERAPARARFDDLMGR